MPRHRRPAGVPGVLRAIVVALVLAGVVGAVWIGSARIGGPGCPGQVRLTVAAAPEIAPVVETAAKRWTSDGARVDQGCVTVDVAATSPVDVATTIAGRQGVALAGVGQAGERVAVPDVWVPDSTTWLTRLQAAAAGLAPASGPSLARSAIVVAVPEPVGKQLGWSGRRLSYRDLLTVITSNTKLHVGIVDPGRDAGGLAGALALTQAAKSGPGTGSAAGPGSSAEAVLRTLAVGSSTLRQDLLNKFPRQPDPASLAAAKVTVAPLPEQAVIAYNAGRPPVRLAAFYLSPQPPPLDYPYVVMPGLNAGQTAAADALRGVLTGTAFRAALARNGLRGPDGTAGAGFAAPSGAPAAVTPTTSTGTGGGSGSAAGAAVPDAAAVKTLLQAWTAVTARSPRGR